MPFKKNDPNINRNGRPPRDQSWAELSRAMAGGPIPESLRRLSGDARSLREAVTLKVFEMALEGNIQAIKLIQERSEGRPTVTPDIGRERTDTEKAFDDWLEFSEDDLKEIESWGDLKLD